MQLLWLSISDSWQIVPLIMRAQCQRSAPGTQVNPNKAFPSLRALFPSQIPASISSSKSTMALINLVGLLSKLTSNVTDCMVSSLLPFSLQMSILGSRYSSPTTGIYLTTLNTFFSIRSDQLLPLIIYTCYELTFQKKQYQIQYHAIFRAAAKAIKIASIQFKIDPLLFLMYSKHYPIKMTLFGSFVLPRLFCERSPGNIF